MSAVSFVPSRSVRVMHRGQITRSMLVNAFLNRTEIALPINGPHTAHHAIGVISSMQHEDGSGYSFNVSLYGHTNPIYVRTYPD